MAKHIKTSIQINASKETVWKVLMDFDKYSSWNPFINSISGALKVGGRIHVQLEGMTFKPKVLVLNTKTEFKWLGHFLFKGLFDGEHRFYLSENKDGTLLFEHSEKFTGILVPLFSKSLDKNTTKGFVEMNQALKTRSESF